MDVDHFDEKYVKLRKWFFTDGGATFFLNLVTTIDENLLKNKDVLVTVTQHLFKINFFILSNVFDSQTGGDNHAKSVNRSGEDYATEVGKSYFAELPVYLMSIVKVIKSLVQNFDAEDREFFETCLVASVEQYITLLDQMDQASSLGLMDFKEIGGWSFDEIELGDWSELYQIVFKESKVERIENIS